jgi:Zn-dependent M28 family amino/carboxypeptidase
MRTELESAGWTVEVHETERLGHPIYNLIARRGSEDPEIILGAHYDTRFFADEDPDESRRNEPVPGANDGASGVAVLLGVADALRAAPPAVGVDLLLVDGEDWGDFADSTETLLGSRRFAARPPPGAQYLFAVVWDMVGAHDLQLYYEGYSQANAPEVVQRVWATADRLGHGAVFRHGVKETLIDDHLPLQQAGIRAIDVIGYPYSYHHTTDDTIDKISAATLQVVGDVAVALLRE